MFSSWAISGVIGFSWTFLIISLNFSVIRHPERGVYLTSKFLEQNFWTIVVLHVLLRQLDYILHKFFHANRTLLFHQADSMPSSPIVLWSLVEGTREQHPSKPLHASEFDEFFFWSWQALPSGRLFQWPTRRGWNFGCPADAFLIFRSKHRNQIQLISRFHQ